ncbi:hypothetical protein EX895_000379 [Sporisorium graminicola]|uniref:C2 domain-containing protein n=1 Tax=Sporisorium graminicola TaxID=280036 RepID=A0A4U7KZN6_9BASI|nr:hypothetical protein EX895_000379 [Sporisorium graminicola]TKY90381.1 hypothetical protein EX895_000379 [Sporisorium graminicola]
MSDAEPSPRKSLSSRRPSFSSIRSRLRKPSLQTGKKTSAAQDVEAETLDDQRSKRFSSASDHSIPPVPPLPSRQLNANTDGNDLAYLQASPSRSSGNAASTSDRPISSKRDSTISTASSIKKEQPAQGDVSTLAKSSLGMTLGAHKSEAAWPDSGTSRYDAQAAFKDTIPMTMLFFGGTVVAILALAKFSIIAAALIAGCSGHILYRKLNERGDDATWALEMEAAARRNALPDAGEESVEWLNKALATAWPLINSDYFAPFVDLLEDSLMTQVPGVVHNVRVEDMDQGSIPLRVKSFRVLPSDDKAFLQGAVVQAHKDAGESDADAPSPHHGDSEDDDAGVDVGDYVNLEVTFAYRGAATKKGLFRSTVNTNSGPLNASGPVAADEAEEEADFDQLKDVPTERIHLLLYLSVGLQKIAAVDIPVWIEMVGIEGKARVRLQMTPVAPFVKHAAVTFVGAPKLEISAKPLGKKMVIDAMNLPLMSSYVLHAVEDVIKGFIAPLSYTVDVAALLGAGDGPQNVYSLGVICFVLHQADDLAAADANGQSDPFVQASFARAGKPLFTSRIVRKRRDAVWQETGFLLVSPDEVRDHDRLRFTVFDADRFSADDPLGKVEISLHRLIRKFHPDGESRSTNLLETRTDKLLPLRKGASVQGTLKYSVGFFGLAHAPGTGHAPSRRKLLNSVNSTAQDDSASLDLVSPIDGKNRKDDDKLVPPLPDQKQSTSDSSVDPDLSSYMTGFDKFVHGLGLPMDDEVLRKRKMRKERVQKLATMIEGAKQATADPPTAELPSGILAFHIHSIAGLEVPSTQKSLGGTSKRLSQKSRNGPAPTDESQAEGGAGGKLPSSYVQVFLNDEAIFRTRTKTLNPRPYINAGSERFIGDWTTARLDFTVRDARMRESDAILGCVGLRLADVLTESSHSTGWYTLTGGLGFGKIRLTLLFRSVELSVPRPLRGWNVGIVEVASVKVTGVPQMLLDKKACHLSLETVGGKKSTDDTEPVDEYESGMGSEATVSYEWSLKEPIRLPVRQRYPSSVYLSLRTDSRLPGRTHHHAWAFLPLNRVSDETRIQRRLRLFDSSEWDKVEQDVLRATSDPELLQTEEGLVKAKLLPVLEELCRTGAATISDEAVSAAKLRAIGWVEVDLIFHRGIAPEHRSCTAGDSEMRFAFDTYMTLLDAGERARPRTLAMERFRANNANATGARPGTHSRTASHASSAPGVISEKTGQLGEDAHRGEGGGGDDGDDDSLYALSLTETELDRLAEEEGDSDSPEGRRARARALHRNQRGAAQIKGFRTLTWMKTNAEDGMAKMKRQFGSKHSKRIGKMEAEGISHF